MTSQGEIFDQKIGDFVRQVNEELADYLPAFRMGKSGLPFNLTRFSRGTQGQYPIRFYLGYTSKGLLLESVDPDTDQTSEWRIETDEGKPVIKKYLKEFRLCQGLLADEPAAIRANVESNFLIGCAFALLTRENFGNFGFQDLNDALNDYKKYDLERAILDKATPGIVSQCLKYEERRTIELHRQHGIESLSVYQRSAQERK